MLLVLVGLLGEDRSRGGLGTRTAAHHLHLVTPSDLSAFDHEAVERELALEPPIDVAGDFLVLDFGVGLVRGHNSAQAQILDPDDDFAYVQAATGPLPLGKPLDATDCDIGP